MNILGNVNYIAVKISEIFQNGMEIPGELVSTRISEKGIFSIHLGNLNYLHYNITLFIFLYFGKKF
jgi:hypothetical protein